MMGRMMALLLAALLLVSGSVGARTWTAAEVEQLIADAASALQDAQEAEAALALRIAELEELLQWLEAARGQTPAASPGGARNVALGKPAEQSSISSWGGPPELAVDGNTDGVWANGSVMHTNQEWEPWWQVDLEGLYVISQIALWNRVEDAHRTANLYVFVSETPFVSSQLVDVRSQPGVWHFHLPNQVQYPTVIPVNRRGRYVRVQLADAQYLHLAEVEVWGY